MNRVIQILLLLLLSSTIPSFAQQGEELTGTRREAVVKSITTATQQVKQLECSFRQKRESKMLSEEIESTGTMEYNSPDHLQWNYTSPSSYGLQVDGDKVKIHGKGPSNGAIPRQVKAMSRLIVGCVNGNQLFDERLFKFSLYEDEGCFYILLVPKRKEMQKTFQSILFTFDKQKLTANSIVLTEKSGEKTVISFHDIKVKY